MKNTRKILTISLCLCLMLASPALSSCSTAQGSAGSKGTEAGDVRSDAPETTVVRLALSPHGHVFNAIAEEHGFLADEGITVEYVEVTTDTEVFEGIAAGTIDVASNSGTNLPLQQISEGMDLTIFGGYLLTGCMPIFARVETEWNGIEDLVGKTVAFEPNLYAVTGPLLDKGCNPLADINWYNPEDQHDRITAVENGDADFGLVGTYFNYEIISNPNLKVITYASDILPNYSCCRVEALTEWINKNPNTVKALLRAWIRAMAYYDTHHDEAVRLAMQQTGFSEEVIRAYMDNPRYDLNIDPMKASVKRAWNYMGRLGLLNLEASRINIDSHINTALYKEALDECQSLYGEENPKFYENMQAQFSKYNP